VVFLPTTPPQKKSLPFSLVHHISLKMSYELYASTVQPCSSSRPKKFHRHICPFPFPTSKSFLNSGLFYHPHLALTAISIRLEEFDEYFSCNPLAFFRMAVGIFVPVSVSSSTANQGNSIRTSTNDLFSSS